MINHDSQHFKYYVIFFYTSFIQNVKLGKKINSCKVYLLFNICSLFIINNLICRQLAKSL